MSNPIYVTRLDDDAAMEGTLRYAVAQVNAGLYDSIIMDPSLSGQTIELLSSLTVSADTVISGTDVTVTGKPLMLKANVTLDGLKLDFQDINQGLFVLSSGNTIGLQSTIALSRDTDGDLSGIKLNNGLTNMEIRLADSAAVSALNNGTGNVYGFSSKAANSTMTFGTLGNTLNVTAKAGTAAGVWSYFENTSTNVQTVTAGDFTGNWSVTASADAYGFYLKSNDETTLTLQKFTGILTVESTESEAYGIYSSGSNKSTVSMGNFEGEIKVTAAKGNAVGISITSTSITSTSSVMLGNFTGHLTVIATNGSATGISTYTYYYRTSSVTLGGVTGHLTVTATNGSATGISSYSPLYSSYSFSVTLGDFSGHLTVSATNGSATGISCSSRGSSIVSIKSFTGELTAASSNGTATGITTKTLRSSETESTVEVNGVLIADGKNTDSRAISAEKVDLSVNKILAAGYFQTTESETGMADFVAGLKAKEETAIAKAADGCNGYYSVVSSTAQDDAITVNNGALVFGGFSLAGGTNDVTISTGARMYGNLTADTMNLTFTADALSKNAALTVTEDGVFATDNVNYKITIDSTTVNGSYTLVDGLSLNVLDSKLFTLVIDGSEQTLLVGESVTVGGRIYGIAQQDDALMLTVSQDMFFVNNNWKDGESVSVVYDGTTYTGKVGSRRFSNDESAATPSGLTKAIVGARGFNGSGATLNENYANQVSGGFRSADNLDEESSGNLTVTDGFYNRSVNGGDTLTANGHTQYRTGNVNFSISGGTFNQRVTGGMFYNPATQEGQTGDCVTLTGNVRLTISGGTFRDRIFGGNNATSDDMGKYTVLDGSINLMINATEKISFDENIVAGSRGKGVVTQNTTVKFTGSGENLTFADDSIVWGGCSGDSVNITTRKQTSSVKGGTRTLSFSGFTGDFNAQALLFTDIQFSGNSSVNFSDAKIDLQDIEVWDFAAGSTAELNSAVNDFTDDVLNITGNGTEKLTLLTADNANVFANFGEFDSVAWSDCGTVKYNETLGVWTDGTSQLALEENEEGKWTMTLSTIA